MNLHWTELYDVVILQIRRCAPPFNTLLLISACLLPILSLATN